VCPTRLRDDLFHCEKVTATIIASGTCFRIKQTESDERYRKYITDTAHSYNLLTHETEFKEQYATPHVVLNTSHKSQYYNTLSVTL